MGYEAWIYETMAGRRDGSDVIDASTRVKGALFGQDVDDWELEGLCEACRVQQCHVDVERLSLAQLVVLV